MKSVSGTTFARNLGAITDEVRMHRTTVKVTLHGRPSVIVMHPDEYDDLQAARRELAVLRQARLSTEVPRTQE